MTIQKPTPVPPPSHHTFRNGISHPDLWLWDSWTAEFNGTIHLYCLAISRINAAGEETRPADRNDYPFHIRHFTSDDGAVSWQDQGSFLTPRDIGDGAFARNIWSGCVLAREEGGWLCGFTGLRHHGADKPFLQTICIGRSSDGYRLDEAPKAALSCPVRDHDMIRAAGYYLPPKEELGSMFGEEGGPILAWRDPFIVENAKGVLEVFWSAKISPTEGAVAHATVKETDEGFEIEHLHPPMTLPDAGKITQAEVPKIQYDPNSGSWFMMISACDRMSEQQPAEEVTKVLRIYRSSSLRGPWTSAFGVGDTMVSGAEFLFGASFLETGAAAGRVRIIAPYTEYADERKQLTFAEPLWVNLSLDTARRTSVSG